MDARTLIVSSVGKDGANNSTDVRVVQRLLNFWLAQSGQSHLAVNGVAGPETMAAIVAFQRANGATPSGKVEAGAGIEALFNQHLTKLVDSIDLSAIDRYRDKSMSARGALSDPAVSDALRSYIEALRKLA